MLNDEVIACGIAPTRPVLSGTATSIATGGPVPRGADAIVMVEHTQPAGPRAIEIRRAASPGQFVSYAGSDIARGESAAARRHRDRLARDRHAGGLRHRAGVASRAGRASRSFPPATNWCSRASRCARPRSTTPTARSSPRRSRENGGEAMFLGAIADDEAQLEAAMRKALADQRHAGAVGRHLEGRGRRLPSHHRAARQARHHRAWRRAEARQAAVPCGLRRQAGGDPAGISDLGDVHLSRHDRAGAAAHGGPAAALRCQGQRTACRCGSPPNSAAPNSSWCRWSKATDGLIAYPDRQGLRRHHLVRAGRRLSEDRCAGRPDAGRHRGRGDAVHAACAGAGSRHRRQPLHRARSRHRAAGACRARRCARSRSAVSADSRRPSAANATSRRSICSTRRPRPTTRPISATGSNWCRAGGGCRASCSARATRASKA